jgi:putative flippase GtrA
MECISFEKEGKMKEFFKNLKNVFDALTKFQFMRFCVTGSLGVITYLLVSYIFRRMLNIDPEANGLTSKIPMVPGFIASVIQNYFLNHFWTFGKETENHRVSFKLFGKFCGVCMFSLIPRIFFYFILYNMVFSQNNSFIAALGGIVAGMFTNFFGSKFVVFRFKEDTKKLSNEAA